MFTFRSLCEWSVFYYKLQVDVVTVTWPLSMLTTVLKPWVGHVTILVFGPLCRDIFSSTSIQNDLFLQPVKLHCGFQRECEVMRRAHRPGCSAGFCFTIYEGITNHLLDMHYTVVHAWEKKRKDTPVPLTVNFFSDEIHRDWPGGYTVGVIIIVGTCLARAYYVKEAHLYVQ